MQTYNDLVELARLCGSNAHYAATPKVARVMWTMAQAYQRKAANRADGQFPYIGPLPALLREDDRWFPGW